jgi:subtilase-type serine protease
MPRSRGRLALAASVVVGLISSQAAAQGVYTTLDYGSNPTFLTGIRGPNIVGNYVIPGTSSTGGLLYNTTTGVWTPFPVATSSGADFPNATGSSPYGPNFGNPNGVLRVVGSYITSASSPYNLSYLYDGAAASSSQLTTLVYPSASSSNPTLETIAHSTFGNQVVGNYDTRLATGNAFIYNINTGTYVTNNFPGALSTTAYGIYGNLIAGGYSTVGPGGGLGIGSAYIYNETTGAWTTYNHPGAIETHFEGISGGGQAGSYNLVANWTGLDGQVHASVLHIDALGNQTWLDYSFPGSVLTSANSIYGNQAIGIYIDSNGGTHGYVLTVPGIYNPVTISGGLLPSTISTTAANTPAIFTAPGDDVLNNGTIATSGINSPGVKANTYSVVTNNGTISVTGAGSAAVDLNGTFGTVLNSGTLSAVPGAYALLTEPSASGTVIVNTGTINGQLAISPGAGVRFENSGWLGINAPGAGTTHTIGGTFVQTSAGTLAVRIAPSGIGDLFQITGTANVAGAVDVLPTSGTYAAFSRYPFLTATGGVSGAFGQLISPSLALPIALQYMTNEVDLVIGGFTGQKGNQTAVASALNQAISNVINSASSSTNNSTSSSSGTTISLTSPNSTGISTVSISSTGTSTSTSNTGSDFANALSLGAFQPTGQMSQTLASLGGQTYANLPEVSLQDRLLFLGAMGERMRSLGSDGTVGMPALGGFIPSGWGGRGNASELAALGSTISDAQTAAANPNGAATTWPGNLWARGFGQFGHLDSNGGAAGANYSTGGGAIGADLIRTPESLFGVAVSGGQSSVSTSSLPESGTISFVQLGAYGVRGLDYGGLLDGAVIYAHDFYNVSRGIVLPGTSRTATSSYGGDDAVVDLGISRPLVEDSWQIIPRVGLAYFHIGQSSFAESGASSLDLTVNPASLDALRSRVGVTVRDAVRLGDMNLQPEFRAAWTHDFLDDRGAFGAAFVGAPSISFQQVGAATGRDAADLGVGVSFAIAQNAVAGQLSSFVQYDATIAAHQTNNIISAGLKLTW